jgi:integrase
MKIEKFQDKKEKRERWRARFQLHKVPYAPTADSYSELMELVDEIRGQIRRSKYNLSVPDVSVGLEKLFDRHREQIQKDHQKNLAKRVFRTFLKLLPEGIKVTELRRAHFQKYIDHRLAQTGVQSKDKIKPQTVNREMNIVGAALSNAPLYFAELEDYRKPQIPKAKVKQTGRDRLVNVETELKTICESLRRPRTGKQTGTHHFHRISLADFLEFNYETGLRRKEITALKKSQYEPKEKALINVVRWKTSSRTKFFPLSKRAAEIVERRIKDNPGEYLFSPNGSPIEANYRTLKEVCSDLGIVYGRYKTGGFVTHDLRHNFASEMADAGDVETVREYLGHSSLKQMKTYLHTNPAKMKKAMRKRENADFLPAAVELYKELKRGKIGLKKFIEKVRILSEF